MTEEKQSWFSKIKASMASKKSSKCKKEKK
jgi:hypothetical protein